MGRGSQTPPISAPSVVVVPPAGKKPNESLIFKQPLPNDYVLLGVPQLERAHALTPTHVRSSTRISLTVVRTFATVARFYHSKRTPIHSITGALLTLSLSHLFTQGPGGLKLGAPQIWSQTPKCVTLLGMRTQTIIYRNVELDHFYASIDHMESKGWSIRHILLLEPVIEVKKVLPVGAASMMIKILSILVVYERDHV